MDFLPQFVKNGLAVAPTGEQRDRFSFSFYWRDAFHLLCTLAWPGITCRHPERFICPIRSGKTLLAVNEKIWNAGYMYQ